MVSFCDIKISQLKDHIEKYGYYGIGLSKKWAFEKGLNPAIYLNDRSHFPEAFIENILSNNNTSDKKEIDRNYALLDAFRYMKNYEGRLERKGELNENYCFAEEREWRYVPKMNPDKFEDFISEDELDENNTKEVNDHRLSDERLYFNPDQILYLIVKEESEIEEFINHIRDVKSEKYSHRDVERLMTRIISCERILNDF